MGDRAEQQRGQRLWFVCRGSNIYVPVVPLDELPDEVVLNGLPRQMTYDQVRAANGEFLGLIYWDGHQYALETQQQPSQFVGPGINHPPETVGGAYRMSTSQQPYFVGNDPTSTGPGHQMPAVESMQAGRHHQRIPSMEPQPYYPSPAHQQQPMEEPFENQRPSVSLSFPVGMRAGEPFQVPSQQRITTERTGTETRSLPTTATGSFAPGLFDNSEQPRGTLRATEAESGPLTATAPEYTPAVTLVGPVPASSDNPSAPARGEKIYCSYWIRTGTCDYLQQGCRYRHEMPDNPQLLQEITGLTDTPKWYREAQEAGIDHPTSRLRPHRSRGGRAQGSSEARSSSHNDNESTSGRYGSRRGRAGGSWRQQSPHHRRRLSGDVGSGRRMDGRFSTVRGSPQRRNEYDSHTLPRRQRRDNEKGQDGVALGRNWSPIGRGSFRGRGGRGGRPQGHSQQHQQSTEDSDFAAGLGDQNTPWEDTSAERAAEEGGEAHQPGSRDPGTQSGASDEGVNLVDIGETLPSLPALPVTSPSTPSGSMRAQAPSAEKSGASSSPYEGVVHNRGALIPDPPKYIQHFQQSSDDEDKDRKGEEYWAE